MRKTEVMAMLLMGIEKACGAECELSRDFILALESGRQIDMMLAEASFDALPGEKRREIMEIVTQLSAERTGRAAELA